MWFAYCRLWIYAYFLALDAIFKHICIQDSFFVLKSNASTEFVIES